jgi:hypothetical protein
MKQAITRGMVSPCWSMRQAMTRWMRTIECVTRLYYMNYSIKDLGMRMIDDIIMIITIIIMITVIKYIITTIN